MPVVMDDEDKQKLVGKIMGIDTLAIVEERYVKHLENAGLFADRTKTNTRIQVKCNCFFHEDNLKECMGKCEDIALSNKLLVEMCKALNSLSQIK